MADDPNNRGTDRWFVSWQPHEIDYVLNHFPRHPRDRVRSAVEICKKLIQPSEGRQKLMECIRKRLG
jgi:hypothetical protein